MPLKLYRRTAKGAWYIRGTVAGQRLYQSTGTGNRARAEALRARIEAQLADRAALGPAATLTFAEAALAYMQAGGESRFLAPILKQLGPDALVADITNQTIAALAPALYPAAAPATINRQLITPVSAVVNHALDQPRRFTKWKAGGGRTRWLRPHEFDRLLDQAAPHLVPVLAALVGSGMRTSEALGVQSRDFWPATGEIWLPDTKNGHPRMVRLPWRARDLVLAHMPPQAGAVFHTPKGAPYALRQASGGNIKAGFDRARIAADLGPDVTPHVLRHTWATWYYAATRDFGGLLDLGGWRSPGMAQRYRKIAPADLADSLLDFGWDFTQLGRDLPAPDQAPPRLRLVP